MTSDTNHYIYAVQGLRVTLKISKRMLLRFLFCNFSNIIYKSA